jgi:hypothetical protein
MTSISLQMLPKARGRRPFYCFVFLKRYFSFLFLSLWSPLCAHGQFPCLVSFVRNVLHQKKFDVEGCSIKCGRRRQYGCP